MRGGATQGCETVNMLLLVNTTKRIRLGVTIGLICAANRHLCTNKTFENLFYLLMTAATQFYLALELKWMKVFYKVKEGRNYIYALQSGRL